MANMLRIRDLVLGELEQAVLETLWADGPLPPGSVHQRVGEARGISVNTVSSALKRLHEKGMLEREKVSHSFVYSAAVTRSDLQGQLIAAVTDQFDDPRGGGLLAAFVDFADSIGEETLRELERLVASRLAERGDT